MALFTIYEGDICGISLARGPGPPREDPGAVKVDEFRAASWPEACQRLNDRYGWGPYRDDGRWEEIGPEEE